MLTTIATVELGSAIAKAILKLWIKDSQILSQPSDSLIDILKTKTQDVLVQRRVDRQFQAIGDKVAEALIPFFQSEHAGLDSGGLSAIALEIADTLNKANINSQVLASNDLEPQKLARYLILSKSLELRAFSQNEIKLYERIIQESSVLIIEMAFQLPAFQEKMFGELFKRDGMLLDKADEILQEIQNIRITVDPIRGIAQFEADYRLAIVRKLDEIELFGVDLPKERKRHNLSVAYVTLNIERKIEETKHKTKHAHDVVDSTISVDRLLAESRRIVIRGSAGSGKTTLLQWIAVRSASKTHKGNLTSWNELIPLYIRLRQCVQNGLPTPESFPGLTVPIVAGRKPEGWVNSILTEGKASILIDGLDEIPFKMRAEVRSWIKELTEIYPLARFIITTRPHAIEEGWMDTESFAEVELLPMNINDIRIFIDHWHEAVLQHISLEDDKSEIPYLSIQLKTEIEQNRSLLSLATTPLLCAMLCALNKDRHHKLPSDRIELYNACCHLLIERRDNERSVLLSDYPSLDYRQKLLLLQDIAYWYMRNGWSEADINDIDVHLSQKITNMQNVGIETTGSSIRRLFVERTGIIREPVTGKLDFTHRTFQEFFAAQASLDEGDIGLLIGNAQDDQWRELIILACGLASRKICEQFINGLIVKGDMEVKYRHQLHLLAVSCLETTIELDKGIRNEVISRLSKLVPPPLQKQKLLFLQGRRL